MPEKKVTLPAISCHHCAMTINRELSEIPGIQKINVDVNAKQLAISWEAPATWDIIKNKLAEIGYPASDYSFLKEQEPNGKKNREDRYSHQGNDLCQLCADH